MKKCILALLIIAFSQAVVGQSEQTDSLKQELKIYFDASITTIVEDTTAIKNLIQVSKDYLFSDYDSSLHYGNKAIELAKTSDWEIGLASALANKGNIFFRVSYDFDSALVLYKQAIEIHERINASELGGLKACKLYYLLNSCYSYQGKYEQARTEILQSLKIAKKIEHKKYIINGYNVLGSLARNLYQFEESIDYYNKCYAVIKEIDSERHESVLLGNIGITLNAQGKYKEAIDYYNQAIEIDERLGNKSGLIRHYSNASTSYRYLGELDNSIEVLNIAYQLTEETGDAYSKSVVLSSLAIAYNIKGDYKKALEHNLQALELSKSLNDVQSVANTLGNIGLDYQYSGNFLMALEYHKKSIETMEENGLMNNGASLGNIELNSTAANCLADMGNLKRIDNKYEEALVYYERALAQYESMDAKYNLAITNSQVCRTYSLLNRNDEAIAAGQIALDNAISSGNPLAKRLASTNMYLAQYKRDEYDLALSSLSLLRKTIIEGIEMNYFGFTEKEREDYLLSLESEVANYFDFGVIQQDRYPSIADTMYNLALSNKGLSLKSSTYIRRSIINSKDSVLINDYEEFISNKKKIADNFAKGERDKELEDQVSEQERSLIERSGAFSDYNTLKNVDWKAVRDDLEADEAAIEFIHYKSAIDSLGRTHYAAMIIKKNSEHPEVIQLCTEDELILILEKHQGSDIQVVKDIYGQRSKPEKEIYNKVWEPMMEHLEGIKKVYYSPSGLLHKISFAAISNGSEVLLCDQFNLYQQSSTRNITQIERPGYNKTDQFMLVGGVQYNSSTTEQVVWDYLPGTEVEINTISNFLNKKKHTVSRLEGSLALENTLKENAGDAAVLHISTHGFFFPDPEDIKEQTAENDVEIVEHMNFRGTRTIDSISRSGASYMNWNFVSNKNPLMRSGLVLAGANDIWQRDPNDEGEDGVLTAQEVSNLNLMQTKLVVLSACETGLGDIKGSEGVFGLQRAFKMAGANYVIMSLWQVPDVETAEFMEIFYKNLSKKKDIPEAFQLTQRTMRKKYDPYYWAAFVLID